MSATIGSAILSHDGAADELDASIQQYRCALDCARQSCHTPGAVYWTNVPARFVQTRTFTPPYERHPILNAAQEYRCHNCANEQRQNRPPTRMINRSKGCTHIGSIREPKKGRCVPGCAGVTAGPISSYDPVRRPCPGSGVVRSEPGNRARSQLRFMYNSLVLLTSKYPKKPVVR